MKVDAVLSYHMNPATCGVAKFNHALAERLGVPCLPLTKQPVAYPLISVKSSEVEGDKGWPLTAMWYRAFDLFCHDEPHGLCAHGAVQQANRVYAGNKTVADYVRTLRPDVIEAFCPSTVNGNPDRGRYRVLAFGMAHKLALEHFARLKMQLDIEHPDYTVSLSTAVHEGSPWDEALTTSVHAMRGIFGDKLRVLGYLGDDALAKELQDCDAVAVYFDPAVRENNTTLWAALEAGKKVYTNTDEHSPPLDPAKYSWEALTRLLA